MIAIDYSVLFQIVAFLLLWLLLTKLLFHPFLRVIEEREKRTEGARDEAGVLLAETERLRREYESRMAKARDEGEAGRQAIVAEAARAREQVLARARESAASFLQVNRQQIARELEDTRRLVGQEAQAAARQIAEKILGRKIG
jgi:F-type H+-transporting ATPase subunit b